MKNYILLLVLLATVSISCERRAYKSSSDLLMDTLVTNNQLNNDEFVLASDVVQVTLLTNLYVKEIHGCEYVVLIGAKQGSVTHHEACNNVNHRCK
jgi:hypothetical protein